MTQGSRHQTAQTLQAEDRRAVRVQHAVQLLERAGAGALEVAVLQQLHRRAVPLHHGRIQRVHLLHHRVLTLRHIAVQLHGDKRQHEEVVQQVGVHQLQRVLLDVVLHQRVDHAARQQQVEQHEAQHHPPHAHGQRHAGEGRSMCQEPQQARQRGEQKRLVTHGGGVFGLTQQIAQRSLDRLNARLRELRSVFSQLVKLRTGEAQQLHHHAQQRLQLVA